MPDAPDQPDLPELTEVRIEPVGGVRDHLANERTQLAWLRTGATVMVVGLGIARFGDAGEVTGASVAAGSGLVLAGAATIGYGTWRYRRLAAELSVGRAPSAGDTVGPTVLAVLLLLSVLLAAVVLVAAG